MLLRNKKNLETLNELIIVVILHQVLENILNSKETYGNFIIYIFLQSIPAVSEVLKFFRMVFTKSLNIV